MFRLNLRLPRFQFFHDTRVLLTSAIQLVFTDPKKTSGQKIFLSKVCTLFERKQAHIVSSYRMGLHFTLKSLQLEAGSEVLLTPITIADTVNAIKLAGLTPVFVDMDLDTHSICLDDLQKKISNRSKVLLITYLSGIVPDIEKIKTIAGSNGLLTIEDISQNMGATFNNQKIGSHADVSIASLSCGKNISTLYGGLILSNNEVLLNKIKQESETQTVIPQKSILGYYLLNCIKVQIATSRLFFPILVFPLIKLLSILAKSYPVDFDHDTPTKNNVYSSAKPVLRTSFPDAFYTPINDWQFNLVNHQLERVTEGTRQRRKLADILINNLSSAALEHMPNALLKTHSNSYYHFPIYCKGRRSELRKHLFESGIDNGSYGLNLCSEEKAFNLVQTLPHAVKIKHDSIFLPIHESYTDEQMLNVAAAVNKWFE